MGIDFALGTGDRKTPAVLGFVLEGIIQDSSVAVRSAVNVCLWFFEVRERSEENAFYLA
jgi:hypothetical protein